MHVPVALPVLASGAVVSGGHDAGKLGEGGAVARDLGGRNLVQVS